MILVDGRIFGGVYTAESSARAAESVARALAPDARVWLGCSEG